MYTNSNDISTGNNEKENYRMKEYKTFGRDSKDFRRKFIESNVELRKCNKQDKLEKRRHIVSEEIRTDSNDKCYTCSIIIDRLKKSTDSSEISSCILVLRKLVSIEGYLPQDRDLMTSVPVLVSFLETSQSESDIHDILWILTNLTYHPVGASYVMAIKQSLEIFLRLLSSQNMEIVTQSLWLVANIVGETVEFARRIEQAGFIAVVLDLAMSSKSFDFHEMVIWFFGNFLRYNKIQNFQTQTITAILEYVMIMFNTKTVKLYMEIMRCIDYVLVMNDHFCHFIVSRAPMDEWMNVICRNVETDANTINLFLRSIGHLVAGENDITKKCLDFGLVPACKKLYLSCKSATIAKHIFWILSNICVSPDEQRQSILDHNVIEIFVNALTTYANYPVVLSELFWCFRNYINESSLDEYEAIMSFDWMSTAIILCKTKTSSLKVLDGALRSFDTAFQKAAELNLLDNVLHMFSANGGCDILEDLQNHNSSYIYELSRSITERYFQNELNEYGEDENLDDSLDHKFQF